MTVYEGGRYIEGVSVTADGQPLTPRFDLMVFSSSGFEWSYEGDGPRQLSLALLADHLDDDDLALQGCEAFMVAIVANLGNAWRLSTEAIDAAARVLLE